MENYDAFAETFSNSRKNMHWPEVDEILLDLEKKGYKSVLDIGCGNGRFLGELRKRFSQNMNYLGVDNSKGMVEEAKKIHPNERFLIDSMPDLVKMPREERYDAIILLASFHHLETLEGRKICLENLKEHLSTNGTVYMTNWNLLKQEKYQKNHRGNGDFDIKIGKYSRYYHGFSVEELDQLLTLSGWKIINNKIYEGGRNIYSVVSCS